MQEIGAWRDAATALVVPYDEALGVHSQAEGFTSHEIWDFDATTDTQYPLLLHFPYFDLYRKRVVKQADLVLAMHLRGEAFTTAEQRATPLFGDPAALFGPGGHRLAHADLLTEAPTDRGVGSAGQRRSGQSWLRNDSSSSWRLAVVTG